MNTEEVHLVTIGSPPFPASWFDGTLIRLQHSPSKAPTHETPLPSLEWQSQGWCILSIFYHQMHFIELDSTSPQNKCDECRITITWSTTPREEGVVVVRSAVVFCEQYIPPKRSNSSRKNTVTPAGLMEKSSPHSLYGGFLSLSLSLSWSVLVVITTPKLLKTAHDRES